MGFVFSSCKETEDTQQQQQKQQTQTQTQRKPKTMSVNDQRIIELKRTRDQIQGKQKSVEVTIEKLDQIIKDLVKAQKKDRAKFQIEKKKLNEKFLSEIDNKCIVIQKMIKEVEQATMDQDITEVMKNANKFLKDIQEANLDKLQDAQADLQESEQAQEQMKQLFQDYGLGDNQEELEQQYNQLEAALVGDQVQQIPEANVVVPEQQMEIEQPQQELEIEQPQQQQVQQEVQQPQQQQQQQAELDEMLA